MDGSNTFVSRLFAWHRADPADWDAIYAEQLPKVLNFLRYRVGPDEAEDLTARVFEKAWAGRRRYRQELAALGTWLLAIARNEAIDHLRKRRRHEPLETAAAIPATGATPEERAADGENVDRLKRLLAALGDRERELIALKYGAGLTNREIATFVGLGESNVGTVLHRTIEALRRGWTKGESR